MFFSSYELFKKEIVDKLVRSASIKKELKKYTPHDKAKYKIILGSLNQKSALVFLNAKLFTKRF